MIFGMMSSYSKADLEQFANQCRMAAPMKQNSLGARKVQLPVVGLTNTMKPSCSSPMVPTFLSLSPPSMKKKRKRKNQPKKKRKGSKVTSPKVPIQLSSIRVNRLSGPFGNANGMAVAGLRMMATDRLVTGSIPRNAKVSIVLPMKDTASGLITTAPVVYRAARDKGGFTNSRFDAIPNFGFVATGTHLLSMANKTTEDIMAKYHEARLLVAYVGMSLPSDVLASRYECEEIIYRNSLDLQSLLQGIPKVGTKVEPTEDNLVAGSMAFGEDGKLTVVLEIGCHKRKDQCRISRGWLVDEWISSSILVPYPSSSPGDYNDDDKKRESEFKIKSAMIKLRVSGRPLMAVLSSRLDWTGAMAASGGHYDSFGPLAADSLLESKGGVPLGTPMPDMVAHHNTLGPAPPGSLVYVRYKVATCLDASNLELHVLHSVLHLSVHLPRPEMPVSNTSEGKPEGKSEVRNTSRKPIWLSRPSLVIGPRSRASLF
jgi:hypothetical protein